MDSHISHGPGGTCFSGGDAIRLFQAVTLRSGLKLMKVGIRPSRGWSKSAALAVAYEFTGQRYKRTESDRAIADLTVWIETMKSALPVIES